MHFRRPDVSYADEQIHMYSERERELMPLLFLHYPVSVTYCVYKSTPQPLVDPTLLEENAADSIIVLSFNSYQELCTLNAGGTAPTNVRTIMQCARSAAKRSKDLVQFIRKALELDLERRLQPKKVSGLVDLLSDSSSRFSFKRLMLQEEQMTEPMVVEMPSSAAPMQQEPDQEVASAVLSPPPSEQSKGKG